MHTLVYRTDDITKWGTGQGSDLSATTIDLNFWYLFSAVTALEDLTVVNVGIDYLSMVGNQLFVHLTDHSVQGPFTVPATVWNPRGNYASATVYSPLDVITVGGSLYVVNVQHTSATTFNPLATDGLGHDLYSLLLTEPSIALPDDGTPGQRLVKSTDSPFVTEWASDLIRLAVFVGGQPDAGELVMQYGVTDNISFPAGLAGSVAFPGTPAAATATFDIFKNGDSIGSITFAPSPLVSVAFPTQINCVPGDIITLTAPASVDASLSDVSFSLVATLSL